MTASHKRPVMNSLTQGKAEHARVWGTGTWQNIAASALPVVDKERVARLAPARGDRWQDGAAGTGAVALPVARAGAHVSALDLRRARVRTARRLSVMRLLSRMAAVHESIGPARIGVAALSPGKRETVRREWWATSSGTRGTVRSRSRGRIC